VVVVVHCTRMIFADFWTDSFLESEGEFGGTVVDVFGEDLLANNLEKWKMIVIVNQFEDVKYGDTSMNLFLIVTIWLSLSIISKTWNINFHNFYGDISIIKFLIGKNDYHCRPFRSDSRREIFPFCLLLVLIVNDSFRKEILIKKEKIIFSQISAITFCFIFRKFEFSRNIGKKH